MLIEVGTHKHLLETRTMKHYKKLGRGQWAEMKLKALRDKLPNDVASDIGSGFGWFGPILKSYGLKWQPFDYIRKIEESTIWDLNFPAPAQVERPGFVVFLEVLEHLSNPELGIRNIATHMADGAYLIMTTPNPLSAESRVSMMVHSKLYGFHPKHLEEHHVFVPLPHIVRFHLENNGLEVLETGTIGDFRFPKPRFSFRYFNSLAHYVLVKLFSNFGSAARGSTLFYLARKKAA